MPSQSLAYYRAAIAAGQSPDSIEATNVLLGGVIDAVEDNAPATPIDPDSVFPPPHDSTAVTYVGSTNNVDEIVYSRGGSVIGTVTFSYVAAGAADDDKVSGYTYVQP